MDNAPEQNNWATITLIVSATILGLLVGRLSSQIQNSPLTNYEADYYLAYDEFEQSEKNYSDILRIKEAEKVFESHRAQDTDLDFAYRKRDSQWTKLSFLSMALCLVLGLFASWKAIGALPAVLAAVAYYLSGFVFFLGGPNMGIATGTIPLINGAVALLAVVILSHFVLRLVSK
jgi:hypothetical protein